ncbi:MAG: DUF4358 domain-containing protein [Pseudoflavonifractor sp.]
MNQKLLSLTIAGVLSLSLLAGCSAPAAKPSTPPETTPPVTAAPTTTPGAEPTETPALPEVTETPAESAKPSDKPVASAKPTVKPEAPAKPSTKPETSAVQSTWTDISALDLPSLMDMDAELLTEFYGINAADLTEFVAKMPMMSAHVTEFLIAKVAPGKMDAVKKACETRQATLAGMNQYPDNIALVKDYQLVVNGDYILFAIDNYAKDMAEIFNTYTK